MRPILIRGGRIIDPSRGTDEVADLFLADGKVQAAGRDLGHPDDAQVLEAAGKVVVPGLIDVHVHLEAGGSSESDAAARDYFGDSGAPRDPDGLAEYYRSRRIAFVVFTVDERLSGRRHVTNDEVVRFAADNADVAVAFASLDPTRGPEAVVPSLNVQA